MREGDKASGYTSRAVNGRTHIIVFGTYCSGERDRYGLVGGRGGGGLGAVKMANTIHGLAVFWVLIAFFLFVLGDATLLLYDPTATSQQPAETVW